LDVVFVPAELDLVDRFVYGVKASGAWGRCWEELELEAGEPWTLGLHGLKVVKHLILLVS
jgi:hypothetical protein